MNPPPSYESSLKGWRSPRNQPSFAEAFETVPVPKGANSARKFLAFLGPGYLVAVGYMDPGNWATDLAGGSAFGYTLLSVILISNFMAILLQALAARLGLVTGRDLAQACRDHYSPLVSRALWVLCEVAICACDLAEVLGTAIALNLLFNIPLSLGVLITLLDVFFVLWLLYHGYRLLEAFIITLVLITGLCFAFELFLAQPAIGPILAGFWPSPQIVQDPHKLLIAVGILGATVMPHNLYLHSSLVQTRRIERTPEGLKQSLRFATVDSTVALFFALFINASILILAASVFHSQGHTEIAEIQDAYHLFAPLLGSTIASTLFAVALLTSGLNSAITATLAGQIVMEGFLNLRLPPWLRRLVTRGIAIIPAFIAATWWGETGVSQLLILSQVILSLQLPFAVVPLLRMTGDQNKMGVHVMSVSVKVCAWLVAGIIIALNIYLLWSFFFSA